MRSYGEYCAVAKALDVVGDRWTLLIVRELSLRGACRYTDLRHGLPGIATNLLADRLRDLEDAGVIVREEAPPPIASTLFRLTPRGEQLRPVLDDLTRWGLPLMAEESPRDAVRSHWLAGALEMMLADRDPGGPPASIELRPGDEPISIEARDGAVTIRLAPAPAPDLVLTGEARPLMGIVLGMIDLGDERARDVMFTGDPGVLRRIAAGAAPAPSR